MLRQRKFHYKIPQNIFRTKIRDLGYLMSCWIIMLLWQFLAGGNVSLLDCYFVAEKQLYPAFEPECIGKKVMQNKSIPSIRKQNKSIR